MTRAASRLKSKPKSKPKSKKAKPSQQSKHSADAPLIKSLFRLVVRYLKHLPTLLIGLIFSAVVYLIITRVEPSSIRHVILPNSYLPLLLAVFLACFFIFSFVLLNTRRGFFSALIVMIVLFLRVQQVIFSPLIIIAVVAPILVIELAFSLFTGKS